MYKHEGILYGDQNVQVPAHLNFGKFMLDRLRMFNNEVALESCDTCAKLTYKELAEYAVNLAVALVKLGVRTGDVVALGSEKRNEYIPTGLAIVFTGATYTPYDLKSGRAILKHKLSLTKPKYLICSSLFWESYSDIIMSFDCIKQFISLDDTTNPLISVNTLMTNNVDVKHFEPNEVQGQNDVACILYSSGTTDMPKGIQLTHLNCILSSLPHDFKDPSLQVAFVFGNWYHNYDIFMTYKFLSTGRKIVYTSEGTLSGIFKAIDQYKANILMIVPSMVALYSKAENLEQYNFESLKVIYSRSSPLHIRTTEMFKKRFPKVNVMQGYGMTECGEPTSESWGTKGQKPGSVGMPSPGLIMKVVDPKTDKILGPNERGEIRLSGPVLMKGYIGVDPSTYLDNQGFFKTGDLGYYDEDNYFYIVDRINDIIVYLGYKIPPMVLETILLAHPKVREAAVIGKVVLDYGEEPAAFVVKQPASNVTEKELVDYVASEVPPYMQLRGGVRFLDELPRNPRGKILRRQLKNVLNENVKL